MGGESFYTQAGTGIQLQDQMWKCISGNGTNVNLQTGYLHLLLPIKPGKIGLSCWFISSYQSQLTGL